jgi:hypothetical protein
MAFRQECHHLGRVLGRRETHHLFVEIASALCRDANGIDAVRHQHAVHHETGRALVTVKEELLQCAEEKEGAASLEGIVDMLR